MNPVKVFTKAVIVFASDLDESRGYVATFVDGKVSAVYPHRPMAEVLVFAERLANNEADLELARIRSTAQANGTDQPGGPTSPHAAEPDAASVASDGSDRAGWAVGLAEQINGRFSSIFGWPEGFVVAEPTPEGGLKLSIGWNDIQVRKDGSSVGGGTDMGTHRMAGVVREAYKIVNPPPSDCSQSGCMPPDYQPEGPIPQFSDPPAADSCEQKRE